jgi:SAM-dependent methyltransferase
MVKEEKINSKEVGLEIGIILGKYFFKTDSLHYGYWSEDLDVKIDNYSIAQEKFDDFLLSNIPENVNNILEVGAGTGHFAAKMLSKGYNIKCVSPSKILSGYIKKATKNEVKVFESKFEDLQTDEKYDMILFSESFQYVNLHLALEKAFNLLKPNGHLLICDFFKTDKPGKCVIGGGHKIDDFLNVVLNSKFQNVKDIDITKYTAPTIDLVDDACNNVFGPISSRIGEYLQSNYPIIYKILLWKFKKKRAKLKLKYFSGKRTAKTFSEYKTYRFFDYLKPNS